MSRKDGSQGVTSNPLRAVVLAPKQIGDPTALLTGGANCTVCLKRPEDLGGNGKCPMKGTIFEGRRFLPEHNCSAFVKGDKAIRRG